MKRVLALVAIFAVALAAPATVEGKKKKPVNVTLSSWQVVLNDNGHPIDAANSTYTYCPTDGVTHIYAIGTGKPAKKGKGFSVTWKLDGSTIVVLKYKTKKGGKVLAPLHSNSGPLADGTYKAVKKNGKKTSSITITLKADQTACV